MPNRRRSEVGFTLVELILVLVLLSLLAAFAASRFLAPSAYSALAAREQLVALLQLAQQRALAFVDDSQPVSLQLTQSNEAWQVRIQQAASTLYDERVARGGAQLKINGVTLANGQVVSVNFDGQGRLPESQSWLVVGSSTHALCIASSGFAYAAACQP